MKCPNCESEDYSIKASEYEYKRCKCDRCRCYFFTMDGIKTEIIKDET